MNKQKTLMQRNLQVIFSLLLLGQMVTYISCSVISGSGGKIEDEDKSAFFAANELGPNFKITEEINFSENFIITLTSDELVESFNVHYKSLSEDSSCVSFLELTSNDDLIDISIEIDLEALECFNVSTALPVHISSIIVQDGYVFEVRSDEDGDNIINRGLYDISTSYTQSVESLSLALHVSSENNLLEVFTEDTSLLEDEVEYIDIKGEVLSLGENSIVILDEYTNKEIELTDKPNSSRLKDVIELMNDSPDYQYTLLKGKYYIENGANGIINYSVNSSLSFSGSFVDNE